MNATNAEGSPEVQGQMPRVSVVIPCYNRAQYLRQAVDSVIKR